MKYGVDADGFYTAYETLGQPWQVHDPVERNTQGHWAQSGKWHQGTEDECGICGRIREADALIDTTSKLVWEEEKAKESGIRKGLPSASYPYDKPSLSQSDEEINHPGHYTQGIETIDYIESWKMDFREGAVIKYVTRARHKGKPLSDYRKARWFIDRLIAELENAK